MKRSIITPYKERCFVCGGRAQHIHHMMSGTANRRLADEDGLVIPVCANCHRRIHENAEESRKCKTLAQKAWMVYYQKDADEFIKRYGKNYL